MKNTTTKQQTNKQTENNELSCLIGLDRLGLLSDYGKEKLTELKKLNKGAY